MKRWFTPPPFPSDDTVPVLADWVELYVLSTGKRLTRGALQTTLRREDVRNIDARLDDIWMELNSRKGLCSKYWPLDVNENGVQLRSHHRNLTLHYFFCALSLGYNIENHGRKLFELCVADLVRVFGSGIVLPVGFPRSAGLPRTMTETVQLYARLSQLELRQVLLTCDKDLGLDIVTWKQFADGRGGWLHYAGQCATGNDWDEKLEDLSLAVWEDHIR